MKPGKFLARVQEKLPRPDARGVKHCLKLFVAGNSPCSLRALRNLTRLCDAHLGADYRLEVIDVHENPELPKANQIEDVPTLVRSFPTPSRKLVGDFSDEGRFCAGLEISLA
jgi:circadian clock protein KaiB